MLWLNAGPGAPQELERRAAAMLPPAGASLVEFLQAVRRLQDGDTARADHRFRPGRTLARFRSGFPGFPSYSLT